MAYEELKQSGINTNTPKNTYLGAGTLHKGLNFTAGKWNFAESLIGATEGGNKITISPEFKTIEPDGALVKMKGLTVKLGETATLETNILEVTPELMKMALVATSEVSTEMTGYDEIKSKARLEDGDYVENLGWIGKTIEGKPIIIIFDYALCTSGFDFEGKNKDESVVKVTFECYAKIDGTGDVLPYHIYTPTMVEG